MIEDYKRFKNDIFEKGEYDLGIPEGDNLVIIDIGAHKGVFIEYIYDTAKVIYAIEPSRANFDVLSEKYGNDSKVKLFHMAIYSTDGEMDLWEGGSDGAYSLNKPFEGVNSEKVKTMTLASFIKNHVTEDKVNLVKMDVEGVEHIILTADDIKEVLPRIEAFVGEVHAGNNLEGVFKDYGYIYSIKNSCDFSAKRKDLS